jgi:hypothetical protein
VVVTATPKTVSRAGGPGAKATPTVVVDGHIHLLGVRVIAGTVAEGDTISLMFSLRNGTRRAQDVELGATIQSAENSGTSFSDPGGR